MKESIRNTILFLVFTFGIGYQIINKVFDPKMSMAAAVSFASWFGSFSFSRLQRQGKFLLIFIGLSITVYIILVFVYTMSYHRLVSEIVDDEFIVESTNIGLFLISIIGSIFLFEEYFKGAYSFGTTLQSIGKFVCLNAVVALCIIGFLGFSRMHSNIEEAFSLNAHLMKYIYIGVSSLLVSFLGGILDFFRK